MMPPLPEPHVLREAFFYDEYGVIVDNAPKLGSYTPKQMTEYGKACRARALAEAAGLCRNEQWDHQSDTLSIRFIDTYKSTPGPWVYAYEQDGYRHQILSDNSQVAQVVPSDHSEADGLLIAAAPDLLAALQRLMCMSQCEPAFLDAINAIKKATGGAS